MPRRKKNKAITEKQVDEMRRLSRKGWSSVAISKRFGCDHTTVLYHVGKLKNRKRVEVFYKCVACEKDFSVFRFKSGYPRKYCSPACKRKTGWKRVKDRKQAEPEKPKPLTYKEILARQNSKEFVRDKKGNLIKVVSKEKFNWNELSDRRMGNRAGQRNRAG